MFCTKCGEKIQEGSKFCFNCGTEVSCFAKIDENKELEINKEELDVDISETVYAKEQALIEIFKEIVNRENQLSFVHFTDIMRDKKYEEADIDTEVADTCIYFNYADKKEGFLVTTEQVIGYYETDGVFCYNFSGMEKYALGKKGLANVLYAYTLRGRDERCMYLTGIRNCMELIDGLNDYIKIWDNLEFGEQSDNNISEQIADVNVQNEMREKISKIEFLIEEKRKTEEQRNSLGFLKVGLKKELDERVLSINYNIGKKVTFGKYAQDYTGEKTPLEWIPIYVTDTEAILLALKGLERRPYHNHKEIVTWEQSDVRKFLNEWFYNNAFSDREKSIIKKYHIDDGRGKATDDFVFLLSREEVDRYLYMGDGYVLATSKIDNSNGIPKADWWLLRTIDGDVVQSVYKNSSTHYSQGVQVKDLLVRPAICISLG